MSDAAESVYQQVAHLTADDDAPGRLRRLTFSLAARGLLVEQNPSGVPVPCSPSDLGSSACDRPDTAALGLAEVKLPLGWCWAHFTDVATIESHLVNPKKYLTMPHVAPDNIEKGTGRLLKYRTIREDGVTSAKHRFHAGQLLYSKIRPNLSKVVLVNFEGLCSADMYPVRAHINPRYLQTFMLSDLFLRQVVRDDNRLAMPKVNQQQVSAIAVAVPPSSEQARIVDKVDQLLACCDELEAKQARRREVRDRLVRAALSSISSAEMPSQVSRAWSWIAERFHTLIDVPAHVDDIRTVALVAAVSGQFSGGCGEVPNHGVAGPAPLPDGWRWVRTDEAGDIKLGRQRSPKNHHGPHMRHYLRVANVHEARIDTRDVLSMNFEPAEVERFLLAPNDVLLNEGQSSQLVGRPALYRGEVPGACFQNTLIRFRARPECRPEYALVVFRAYLRSGRFMREAQQTTNMAHLSAGRLAAIEFPLPPLAEQKRIVERVNQILAICADLESGLRRRDEIALALANAVAMVTLGEL